jgi:hypothetical protein
MNRRIFLVAVSAFALSACAATRSAKVESGSATSYAIEVKNNRSSTIVVSYQADGSTRELGSVASGATQRFVVISSTPSITLQTRTTSGASVGSQIVAVSKAGTTAVTIR